MSELEPTIL